MYCCRARRSGLSPNKISFDRHSCFTDLTQRSAQAFKFGLLVGRGMVFTLPASISCRNDRQNLVSRSCSRYRLLARNPHFCMVDRKSTRLNSSHLGISYAVFCLKKKKKRNKRE